MPGVDALVAEHATDLEYPLDAADHQTLEGQLERDAQVGVEIEGVVVRDERPGRGPALLQVQDRRLYFDEVLVLERATDGIDRASAGPQRPVGHRR